MHSIGERCIIRLGSRQRLNLLIFIYIIVHICIVLACFLSLRGHKAIGVCPVLAAFGLLPLLAANCMCDWTICQWCRTDVADLLDNVHLYFMRLRDNWGSRNRSNSVQPMDDNAIVVELEPLPEMAAPPQRKPREKTMRELGIFNGDDSDGSHRSGESSGRIYPVILENKGLAVIHVPGRDDPDRDSARGSMGSGISINDYN